MQTHSLQKALEFAQDAFNRIKKEGLAPTPQNYEVWYIYYSKESAEITRAIDVMEAKNQKITDQNCQDLHEQFLSEQDEADKMKAASKRIQETIDGLSDMVVDAKTNTSNFSDNLTASSSALRDDTSVEELRKVIQKMKADANAVLEQNKVLETKLVDSVNAVRSLQKDMDDVKKEAVTDSLTGLLNRKAFDEEIKEIKLKIASGEYETFSLLLMDVDHFKKFNDTFGHLVGDQVLKLVARTMVDGVKGRDKVVRYGGEEFVVLLPETPKNFAEKVADNLRKAISDKEVINRSTGEVIARITLSGGVAEYREGEDIATMMERADKALYAAKDQGRNKIISAE